jgi:hypothetical protein
LRVIAERLARKQADDFEQATSFARRGVLAFVERQGFEIDHLLLLAPRKCGAMGSIEP